MLARDVGTFAHGRPKERKQQAGIYVEQAAVRTVCPFLCIESIDDEHAVENVRRCVVR